MRILVLQLCRFGDILQTTPMLRGLRTHQPDAHIVLVVHDAFQHVPIPSDLYDELVALPYTEIAQLMSADASVWPAAVLRLGEFVDQLGSDPFDVSLNLSHGDLSSLLMAVIPSREVRGGLVAPDRTRVVCGEIMMYFWASQLSRAQGCFNLVDLHNWVAGVPSERSGLEVEIPASARVRMQEWRSAHELLDRRYIVVQLGASDERKRWPPERFGDAINMLEPELGEIVLVGTESERPLAERAVARIRRPVHNSMGQAPIPELAALLESAELLLTNDTGTMHVATAVGTRVVDLSTGPVFAHETGPYGDGHFVVEPQMACFPCTGGSTCHHLDCRDAFSPSDIAALVRHAVGRGPLPRPAGARVLQGRFTSSGRLEYRPVWTPVPETQDLVRSVSAELWEELLRPDHAGTRDVRRSSPSHRCLSEEVGATCSALERLALRAQNVAALTRRLPTTDTEALGASMAAVEAELEALRLESSDDPACRLFVAHLRVKLDSTTESDVGRLSEAYVKECEHTANLARDLASRLADAVAQELPPAAAV